MSKYQVALQEVMAGECFAGCLLPGQEVTPASIAGDMAAVSEEMQRQLARLGQVGAHPDLLTEALDELATNAGVLRSLAEARVTLALAAEADGLSFVATPEGATLH